MGSGYLGVRLKQEVKKRNKCNSLSPYFFIILFPFLEYNECLPQVLKFTYSLNYHW